MKHMSHSVQASTTLLKSARLHIVQFAGRRGIHQIEQAREGIAQIEAAAAAVADIENAAQLGIELAFVVKIGILPIDGMANRSLQAAFGHWG